jgi:hypothetical protein
MGEGELLLLACSSAVVVPPLTLDHDGSNATVAKTVTKTRLQRRSACVLLTIGIRMVGEGTKRLFERTLLPIWGR